MKLQLIVLGFTTSAFVLGGCASPQNAMDFSKQNPIGFSPLQTRTSTPENITLTSFGPEGQQFSGFLIVDDVRQEISGVTPVVYPIDCVVLSGMLTNASSSEKVGFMVSRPNGQLVTLGADRARWFRYHDGSLEIIILP
jgi:hypothetical protein